MKAVLDNMVSRQSVSVVRPDLDEIFAIEIDGYLDATYPRIDMKFLSWVKDGTPQFAMFTPERSIFTIRRNSSWNVRNLGEYTAFIGEDPVNDAVAHWYTGIAGCLGLKEGQSLQIRYSGMMTPEIRKAIKEFRSNERMTGAAVFIIAETEKSSWVKREVTHEDPLVVIMKDNKFWLLGWYDLTSGEDHVLGTLTDKA